MESIKQVNQGPASQPFTEEQKQSLLAFLVGPDITAAVPDPIHNGSGNPCVTDGDKWWFYNETWIDAYGPYPDEAACREGLKAYCEIYL